MSVNNKKRGLGKGIGSLLGSYDMNEEITSAVEAATKDIQAPAVPVAETKAQAADGEKVIYVPIDRISANKNQPRKAFDEEKLKELAQSIQEMGVIQPLTVVEIAAGRYSIVMGERRFRAAQIAGLEKIPVIVRKLTEGERAVLAVTENIQREDLNPVEEATGYATLMSTLNLTQEEVAKKVGKSRSAVANSLRLLSLPDSIKDDIITGQVTAGHARAILSLENPADRMLLRDKIVNHELSVREAEKLAAEYNKGHKIVNKKEERPQDPEINDVADRFVSVTGIKCEIKGNLDKGRLTLKYNSLQDLERIYSLLSSGDALFTE